MEDMGKNDQPKEKVTTIVISDNTDSSSTNQSRKSDFACGSRKRRLSRDSEEDQIPSSNKRRRINSSSGKNTEAKKIAKPTVVQTKSHPRGNASRKKVKEIPTIEDKKITKENKKQLDYLAQFGKNFYCPANKNCTGLRPIYIDGSNVAFSHGHHEQFSARGLKICIDYFLNRGHDVRAFIPKYRLKNAESSDQKLLNELVKKKLVIITPTLFIKNQQRSPYDDWYIVQTAAANGGIIVSSDNFQDIVEMNPNLRMVVEERRLVPTFIDDMLIFPMDPHGNRENDFEDFLKF
ncbi:unnamed protein product [Ceutorhynchus assimilis]|uniref:RNase NYN domain-containing protein n=1 Tax=Ceutorhynchus assimilis TaxID=467358 RepID=A0A9N9QGR2_9CUCU|nr:unnamed protein product [Ceutorhynchus assimilis]